MTPIRIQPRPTAVWTRVVLLVFTAVLAACAKPPLEEIASAEAALTAAREAKAPELAPEPYSAAEALMVETYRLNDAREYADARTRAIETRDKANEARDAALRARRDNEAAAAAAGDGGRLDVRTDAEARAEVARETIGSGALEVGARIESLQSVYFEFDDYAVRAEERDKVVAAAEWLSERPTLRVRIEGHTDERGSNDYNMALGSRRADSVRQILVSLGIDAERLETRSYGEEAPADPGHNDAAWAQNRRVDFVIIE